MFTQEDPIGLAGGLNLYGFAGGDPINFSDPFGLCAQAGDSVKTTVTVDCGDGTTAEKEIWAQQASQQQMGEVKAAAGRLTGGSAEFTPGDVQWAYNSLASSGQIYTFPTAVDGRTVLEGGLTKVEGSSTYVAFRDDVMSGIQAGDLGRVVGVIGGLQFNVATVVGHEGVHLLDQNLNNREARALGVFWGFIP